MWEFITGKNLFMIKSHNCIYIRDYDYNYFTCSIKVNGKIVEDQQHMLMSFG